MSFTHIILENENQATNNQPRNRFHFAKQSKEHLLNEGEGEKMDELPSEIKIPDHEARVIQSGNCAEAREGNKTFVVAPETSEPQNSHAELVRTKI